MTHSLEVKIHYEDDKILAVEKPIRIHSTNLSKKSTSQQNSVVESILSQFPSLKKEFTSDQEFGLLHRLDFETSGLLLFAKKKNFYFELKKQWKTKSIIKIYRALVPKNDIQILFPLDITHPITQRYRNSKKMTVFEEKMKKIKLNKQKAHTVLVKEHPHPQARDLEIQIYTGVRHQIRAHLQFLKIPILGDTLYGGLPCERLFLHAWKLKLPFLKRELQCPLPLEWGKLTF